MSGKRQGIEGVLPKGLGAWSGITRKTKGRRESSPVAATLCLFTARYIWERGGNRREMS